MKYPFWKVISLVAVALVFSVQSSASVLDAKISRANAHYTAARYDSALVAYQQVLEAGYESSGLYYNLGNTCFKLKNLPLSILYYEKARKLNPADEEVIRNIEVANGMIVDKIEPLPRFFFKQWWDTFYSMFDADSWAWISLIMFILTLVAAFFYLTSARLIFQKAGFFSGLFLLLFTVVSFGLASQRYYYTKQVNEAVIFAPTITVKSSPGNTSVDLFVLHEGTKISLLDEVSGWHKIKIANGSVGWLPNESFREI